MKKLVALVLGMALLGMTTASFAADCKGKVKAVEGTNVTVTCKDGSEVKATGAAKVGEKVTVKDGKIEAKKAVEGC